MIGWQGQGLSRWASASDAKILPPPRSVAERETNVIKPMRTEFSIVSKSKMFEGANMSNKSLRMFHFLVRMSILVFFLILGCSFCLIMGSIDVFQALLSKVGSLWWKSPLLSII